VGKTIQVLVEEEVRQKKEFNFVGRSVYSAPDIDGVVYIQGAAQVGTFVDVHITSSDEYDLTGTIAV